VYLLVYGLQRKVYKYYGASMCFEDAVCVSLVA
jgi:hypothetical protein